MIEEETESSCQICAICNLKSPPTETNYTLISSRHGWRLSLEVLPDGKRNPVWRCPACWQEFRKKNAASGGSSKPPARHI